MSDDKKPTIMAYLGDLGPAGHRALLSNGHEVLIPSHHCLSIGDEYEDDVHGQDAQRDREAAIGKQEKEAEMKRNPHLFPPPITPLDALKQAQELQGQAGAADAVGALGQS